MAVQDLVALIPPPEHPLDAEGDGGIAEAEFGVRSPGDFRGLIRRYGTGEFRLEGLLVSNPLTEAGRKEMQELLWTLRELRDACEFPWAVHLDRPGFLPWGRDSNGNIFWWWTAGGPEEWPVVQLGHNDEENPQRAEVPITTFLAAYARNRYPGMRGGNSFSKSNHRFVVGRPWERHDE